MAERERYEFLDGLRGLAAVGVMVMHYTDYLGAPLLPSAALAVDFFFMLSGFVLVHAYGHRDNGNILKFMVARVVRLYPMFLAGIVIGAPWLFIKVAESGANLQIAYGSLALNLLYLPYFGDLPQSIWGGAPSAPLWPVNNPAWSLFFEMIINIAFLALIRWRFISLILLAAGAFIGIYVVGFLSARLVGHHGLILPAGWGQVGFSGGFPRVTYGFVTGMIIYYATRSAVYGKYKPQQQHSLVLAMLSCAILLLMFLTPLPKGFGAVIYAIQSAAVCPLLLIMGASVNITSLGVMKFVKYLGFLSYPIYCIHMPIRNETELIFTGAHQGLVSLIAFGTTLISAAALGSLYDVPVRRWLSSLRGRGTSALA